MLSSLYVFDQCITEHGIHNVEYCMLSRTMFAANTISLIIENIEFLDLSSWVNISFLVILKKYLLYQWSKRMYIYHCGFCGFVCLEVCCRGPIRLNVRLVLCLGTNQILAALKHVNGNRIQNQISMIEY